MGMGYYIFKKYRLWSAKHSAQADLHQSSLLVIGFVHVKGGADGVAFNPFPNDRF